MRKKLILLLTTIAISLPAFAVLDESDIDITLSELKNELKVDYLNLEDRSSSVYKKKEIQHKAMVDIMHRCNELSIILYSQNSEHTFDMTYAFKEVTNQYKEFNERRMPHDVIVSYLDSELERYARLAESLRRLPPQIEHIENIPDSLIYRNDSLVIDQTIMGSHETLLLEGEALANRDTSLYYVTHILNILANFKTDVLRDNGNYEEANTKLRESYDYANQRFLAMQTELFTKHSDNYFKILCNFSEHFKALLHQRDLRRSASKSEWHGQIAHKFLFWSSVLFILSFFMGFVCIRKAGKHFHSAEFKSNRMFISLAAGFLIFFLFSLFPKIYTINSFVALVCRVITLYSWVAIATLLSTTVIRWKEGPAPLLRLYLPLLVLSLVVFVFRASFISNTLLQIIFHPLLLGTLIWMIVVYLKVSKNDIKGIQLFMLRGTISVTALATILSFLGYNFLSIILVVWLTLQIAILQTLYIFRAIIIYYGKRCRSRLNHETLADADALKETRGDYISSTWFFDLMEIAVIPILMILLFVQCIWYSLVVFDMTDLFESFVNRNFSFTSYDGTETVHFTFKMIILESALFFVFRFLSYLIRSVVKLYKVEKFKRTSGNSVVQTTDINLTLGNNIIDIFVWGVYIITFFMIFNIPTKAITMISTGLAAGLGMAMKDIVNNFIYGIQLMSGRLRPGDWIECEGIRGRVIEIKYQCTNIETIDGAMMSILNADLLSKNFKNLTRNDHYEYCVIKVEIVYGVDLEMVRRILTEGLAKVNRKDRFGQDYVDRKRGTVISFNDFGESGVIIQIEQYILVSMNLVCVPMLKEAIYNILNENGIELPNPQLDVFVKK